MNKAIYATKPTRWTLFMRTFLPWQALRFLSINLSMLSMMHLEHKAEEEAIKRARKGV